MQCALALYSYFKLIIAALPSPCFPTTTTLLNTALLRALVFRPSSLPHRPIHPVPARRATATASRRPPLRESQAREGSAARSQGWLRGHSARWQVSR
jgi:hypothetical protein